MYPVLILRAEVVCLVILIFLRQMSKSYNIDRESPTFNRLLHFAIIHVIFDFLTVLTVNNVNTVPLWVNWICHVIFYVSAILFSNEIMNFVLAICYPRMSKRLYSVGHILTSLYIICLSFLKIEYVEDVGTYSSTGSAAIVGYGLAFVFFIISLVVIFTHWKNMPTSIKNSLIPMMLILMITEICQIIWRSVLFTGGAITIVTVGFFFSLANPIEVFKKKAMTDALTGVRSRNSYEEDIEQFDRDFQKNPGEEYIFVFCDINGLRSVNNRFGHSEGDNYITLIASSINQYLNHSTAVYRIGGDEFLILYYKVNEKTVEKEINNLHNACKIASEHLMYDAGVAVGYAKSSDKYKTLKDVVKSADYAMYQYKTKKATDSRCQATDTFCTRMNYAGLTDKIFDAMCASNESNYPFITNMDTNVTRISSGWREYFGLESEFFDNFIDVWKERIHPDDLNGYLENIAATINGHQKYHNYDYFAKKLDGEYVKVSCHGSVYVDKTTDTSYFTGFIVNHGIEENNDPVTGLRNFDSLTSQVSRLMDEEQPFSIIKLILNNFARVSMLYGHSCGFEVLKKISDLLQYELKGRGEVFCQDSTNFTVLFNTTDRNILEEFYSRVYEKCASGIEVSVGVVPVLLSGGGYINNGERYTIERMRGQIVFAAEESHNSRRNELVIYDELRDITVESDVSILAEIHADALSTMQYFQCRYQPIVDVASGKTVGAEALLRWIHPKYGEILPAKFISFLENDPCYYRLGLAILENSVKDARKFRELYADFRMNVNITALQLQKESFIDNVSEILKKYDYPPEGLVLELTERCKELDGAFLARKIGELRQRGILIAYDDLGTGYSTISLLMDIPVDEIKLDRDFVKEIKTRENYQLFVRALVLGSSSYGNNYNICFEGIEDEEMLDMVKQFGNYLVQGFYFGKPMLSAEFSDYYSKQIQKEI